MKTVLALITAAVSILVSSCQGYHLITPNGEFKTKDGKVIYYPGPKPIILNGSK